MFATPQALHCADTSNLIRLQSLLFTIVDQSLRMSAENSVDARLLRDLAIAAVLLAVNIGAPRIFVMDPSTTVDVQSQFHPTMAFLPALAIPTTRPRRNRKRREFHQFESLPVEIREMIYEHAIINDHRLVLPSCAAPRAIIRHQKGLRDGIAAICFTSSVERSIAMGVFIRQTTFRLYREHDAFLMTSWIRQIHNGNAFRSIRRMEIYYDPYHRFSSFAKDFEFLKLCPGLRHLTIIIPLEELNFVTYADDGRTPIMQRPLTTHELMDRHQFAGILECVNLRQLKFVIPSKYRFEFASTLPLYSEIAEVTGLIVKAYAIMHRRTLDVTIGLSRERNNAVARR